MYQDGLVNIFRGGHTEAGNKKGHRDFSLSPCYFWSRLADSNRRPHPYHG